MSTAHAPAAGSLRSALGHPGFGRFLTATIISTVGDFLNSVGLVVLIYSATHSAAWLGAAAVSRVLSWAAATAIGGVAADRFDRRTLLVSLNVVAGIAAAGLAIAAESASPLGVIIALSVALQFAVGLANPGLAAVVPTLVGERDVAAANAVVTTVEQVSVVAGPALGAVLVAALSPQAAFVCNAISFLVAAVLFLGVPAGGNVGDEDAAPARFREGVAAVRGSRSTLVLLTLFVAAVFAFGFTLVLFVVVAVRRLGMADSSVGYLSMAEGVGGVVASLAAGRLAQRRSSRVLLTAAVLTGLTPVLLARTTTPAVGLAILTVGGGSYVVLEVVLVTWLQRITPDAVMGRVMGLLMSLGAIGTALGAFLAPVLEHTIGLQWTLTASSGALIAVALALAPELTTVATSAASRQSTLAPIVEVLGSSSLLSAADNLTLERLAGAVVPLDVETGTIVMAEGDVADDVYLVRSGSLDVRARGELGGDDRLINTMGPDEWFGEIGLLQRTTRTATVTAAAPTVLWRIAGEAFLAAMETRALPLDLVSSGIALRLARSHPSRVADRPTIDLA